HRDGAIAAIVTIGPKRGGVPFDSRDLWLLDAMTTAAAASWDDRSDAAGARAASLARGDDDVGELAFECPRCGSIASSPRIACACDVPPMLAALPSRLGDKFVVERRLGAGGMGVVYLARDARLDRRVALKTLPELTTGGIARLRDEARAMAALNHESLSTIY